MVTRYFLLDCLPLGIEKFNSKNVIEIYINNDCKIINYDEVSYLEIKKRDNRIQFKINVSNDELEKLLKNYQHSIIKKYYIPLTANIVPEINIYDNSNFFNVNVNFDNLKDARNFIIPDWFGSEVNEKKIKTKIKEKRF